MQIGNSDVVCAALMSVGSFVYLFISDALPACCCNISYRFMIGVNVGVSACKIPGAVA